MSHVVAIPVVDGEPYSEISLNNEVVQPVMTNKERKIFITKVYICVEFQLFCLFGLIMLTKMYNLQHFYVTDVGRGLLGLSIFFSLFSIFACVCCENIYKRFPINYLMLLMFSLGTSYTVSNAVMYIKSDTLMLASGLTTLDVLFITILSFFVDISHCYQFLFVCLISLLGITIINTFILSIFLQVVICGAGSILFSGLLLYDTNQITNVNNRMYTKDDYILASINLYLDILNIFLYILQCLQLTETSN